MDTQSLQQRLLQSTSLTTLTYNDEQFHELCDPTKQHIVFKLDDKLTQPACHV